eukprot:scaffold2557_cov121-Cylindrotheca_fusiformis.AAC.32
MMKGFGWKVLFQFNYEALLKTSNGVVLIRHLSLRRYTPAPVLHSAFHKDNASTMKLVPNAFAIFSQQFSS